MNEHRVYNPYEFMGCCNDSLLERKPLIPSSCEVCPEYFIESYNHECHDPHNPSYMPVSSLGEFALSLKSARLIYFWVKACIGNEFPAGAESFDIPYLTEKMHGCCLSHTSYGCKDIYISPKFTLLEDILEHLLYLSHLLHKEDKEGCLLRKDEFLPRMKGCNGVSCELYNLFFRYFNPPSPVILHGLLYILPRCLSDSECRGESGYEAKDGYTVDIDLLLKFREGNEKEFFHIVLYPCNLLGNMFPLSYKVFKFRGDDMVLGYGFMEHEKKQGNCPCILFIRLCLPQGHLHETGDEKGVYYTTVKPVFGEEGKEVDMVAARGFTPCEDIFLLKDREPIDKGYESLFIHAELPLKEDVLIPVHGTCTEGILGDINTDEYTIFHDNTSGIDSLAMAGGASKPILHGYKGFLTQPTYHGFWRQVTDSIEGFLTQVRCSYPALPYAYYTGYTRLYEECNINS